MRYRSGPFEFDSNDACLRGPLGETRLRKQLAEVLALLWQRAPALVTLDDLLDEVWGRRAISPSAVPQVIRELRRVLGDQAQSSEFLETRHRLGYRWMLPVIAIPGDPTTDNIDTTSAVAGAPASDVVDNAVLNGDNGLLQATPTALTWRTYWLAAALLASIVGAAILWWDSPAPGPALRADLDAGTQVIQSARWAFDALDYEQAWNELDTSQSAGAPEQILRAQIALARADTTAASLALNQAQRAQPTPTESLWIDALSALVEGREVETGKIIVTLLEVTPEDRALNLFALELRKRLPKTLVSQVSTRLLQQIDQLPPVRQLILRVQLAGLGNEDLRQVSLARELLQRSEAQENRVVWAQAQWLLSEALERLGEGVEAQTAAIAAAQAFHEVGAQRAAVRALGRACSIVIDLPDDDRLEQYIALGMTWLESGNDPAGLAMFHHYRAMLYNRREQFGDAVRAYFEQARRYEALGDFAFAATSLSSSAQPLFLLGRGNEIPPMLERAFTLASQANADDTAGYVLGSLANHYLRLGDLVQAESSYLRALERFRASGVKGAEMTTLGNLGELSMMQGRLLDAERHFSAAAVLQKESGNAIALAYAERRQAELKSALGHLVAATQHALAAVAIYQKAAAQDAEASARRVLASLQMRQALLQDAKGTLAAGTHLARSGPAARAELAVIRGIIAFEQGRLNDAEAAFAEALRLRGDTQELVDRHALELSILEVRLARGENVAVEEEARRMLGQPDLRNMPPIKRRAQRILIHALIVGGRHSEAVKALPEMDALLEKSPEAEDTLRVALFRAALDTDAATADDRLDWVQKQAEHNHMRVLALEAQGEWLRRNPERNAHAWRKAVMATGLTRLLAAPKAVAIN